MVVTMAPRPTIVCLCGSTRFSDAFRQANLRETLAGKIVLTIGCDFKSDDALGLTQADKDRMDELHLRKIDLADEVLILNVDGYIGASTFLELQYARRTGKRIRFLEDYYGQPPISDAVTKERLAGIVRTLNDTADQLNRFRGVGASVTEWEKRWSELLDEYERVCKEIEGRLETAP